MQYTPTSTKRRLEPKKAESPKFGLGQESRRPFINFYLHPPYSNQQSSKVDNNLKTEHFVEKKIRSNEKKKNNKTKTKTMPPPRFHNIPSPHLNSKTGHFNLKYVPRLYIVTLPYSRLN